MSKNLEHLKNLICKVKLNKTLYFADDVWSTKNELEGAQAERKLQKGTVLYCNYDPNESDLPECDRMVHGFLKYGTAPIVWENLEDLTFDPNVEEIELDESDFDDFLEILAQEGSVERHGDKFKLTAVGKKTAEELIKRCTI